MCPHCGNGVIPIHYDVVDNLIIQKVVSGEIFVTNKYGLEKFYCKKCQIKLDSHTECDKIV